MNQIGELDLASGRRLYLKRIDQYLTYRGLLEGLPTAERNKAQLEQLINSHRDKPYSGVPYLVEPTETPIERHSDRPYPFGSPAALPAVTCIAQFESLEPAREMHCDKSGLVVIWFQQEFALPIDPSVHAKIQQIDWRKHAADMYY